MAHRFGDFSVRDPLASLWDSTGWHRTHRNEPLSSWKKRKEEGKFYYALWRHAFNDPRPLTRPHLLSFTTLDSDTQGSNFQHTGLQKTQEIKLQHLSSLCLPSAPGMHADVAMAELPPLGQHGFRNAATWWMYKFVCLCVHVCSSVIELACITLWVQSQI